jgi:uncharacterized radical SAM superfamily protein
MCEHCKGSHLGGMTDVSEAGAMLRVIDGLISSGGAGVLVSGGCDVNGSVPVKGAIDAIRYAHGSGLKVNVHTGFIGKEDAKRLRDAGVDTFSVDIHQDPAIIKDTLHLNVPKSAYSDMLDNIISVGGNVAVHLTAGFGAEDLVASAELVKNKGLREAILLALVPTKGTMTEDNLIPEDAVVDAAALLMEMGLEVTLGCMRPRVHRDLERRCIEAGVRRIANPSRRTVSWAKENGFKVIERKVCCGIRVP